MIFPLGATYLGEKRCHFLVWAPMAQKVEVHLVGPSDRTIAMQPQERGYHQVLAEDVPPGSLYYYRLDEQTAKPDPVSHFQPEGIQGPSEVVDLTFAWQDTSWTGVELRDYINLSNATVAAALPPPSVSLNKILDSADQRWRGASSLSPDTLGAQRENSLSIAAKSFVLFYSN